MTSTLLLVSVSARADDKPVAGEIVSVQGTVMIRSDVGKKAVGESRPAEVGGFIYPEDVVNTSSDGKIKILMKDKSIVDLGASALFKVEQFNNKQGSTDREVEVSMVYGTMRAAITQKLTGKGKFKVRTPTATMGVRGTEFVVKSEVKNLNDIGRMLNHTGNLAPPPIAKSEGTDNASTQITVLQGKVDVARSDFNAAADTAGRKPAATGNGPTPQIVSLTAGNQLTTKQSDSPASSPPKPLVIDQKQMASVSSSVKVADNTFQKAVVIEPNQQDKQSGGGQDGGRSPASSSSSSSGEKKDSAAVRPPLVSVITLPPPPMITPTEIGIPGSFQPTQIITQAPVNINGVSRKLRVVITTN